MRIYHGGRRRVFEEPTYPGDHLIFKVASTWHARHRFENNVFAENVLRGLTPANADAAMKYDEFVEDEDYIGDELRLNSRADLTVSRNRK